MEKILENISRIISQQEYDILLGHLELLIRSATQGGYLSEQNADNEYTREIGRVGNMCADYESAYMTFKHLRFKSPLVVGIEKELANRSLKQREAAEMLDIKESTFSQIIRGKRPVSMQMAKRLYKVFNIDPKLILEYA